MERNIRDLEDEIQMLKASGLLNSEDREEELKQMEIYKNHSKFMKTKVHIHTSHTHTHTSHSHPDMEHGHTDTRKNDTRLTEAPRFT